MKRFAVGFLAGVWAVITFAWLGAVRGWFDDAGRAEHQQGQAQPPWPSPRQRRNG